ncbi:class I SAM-dependent methyltransferase [Vicingaceae bacterium]|nr:class I SAM-dependent methyltransferase [Vicingaceae bacterium]
MKKTVPTAWMSHGLALKAYWEGNKQAAVNIHMDDESTTSMPVEIYFRTTEELPEIEKIALELCQGSILDVGAGAGAHSLILQQEYEVIALDISMDGVEIMNLLGVQKTVCGDFLKYNTPQKFDTLLFLMNGIGIAGDLKGLEYYLLHAKTITTQDAQLILDSSDLRNGEIELDYNSDYFGIFNYQLSFEQTKGAKYKWLYIDQELLAKIALNCGWNTEIVYEQEDGSYLARLTKV